MNKKNHIIKEALTTGICNFFINGIFVLLFNIHFAPITYKNAFIDTFITIVLLTLFVSGFSFYGVKKKPNLAETVYAILSSIVYGILCVLIFKSDFIVQLFPMSFNLYLIIKMLWTALFGVVVSVYTNIYLLSKE